MRFPVPNASEVKDLKSPKSLTSKRRRRRPKSLLAVVLSVSAPHSLKALPSFAKLCQALPSLSGKQEEKLELSTESTDESFSQVFSIWQGANVRDLTLKSFGAVSPRQKAE